jgi:hypothetical protein
MRRAKRGRSWFALVLAYVDVKWPRAAAKTRDSMTDALATVTAALVDDRPGQPEALLMRDALRQYALVPFFSRSATTAGDSRRPRLAGASLAAGI